MLECASFILSLTKSLDIHFSKRADQRGKRNRESFDDAGVAARRLPHLNPKEQAMRVPAAAGLHQHQAAFGAAHALPLGPYGGVPASMTAGLPAAYSHMQYPTLPVDASATLYVEVSKNFFFSLKCCLTNVGFTIGCN